MMSFKYFSKEKSWFYNKRKKQHNILKYFNERIFTNGRKIPLMPSPPLQFKNIINLNVSTFPGINALYYS